uniref:Uncharacterized protein n=1 Tax=Arion vulgaris TaxID=1028688 RepID=A0A0B7AFT5_9EUPU
MDRWSISWQKIQNSITQAIREVQDKHRRPQQLGSSVKAKEEKSSPSDDRN